MHDLEKLFQDPVVKGLMSLKETLVNVEDIDHSTSYHVGYEAATLARKVQNQNLPVTVPFDHKGLREIQMKLGSLLKAVTNFQSGFSKGYEKAQELEYLDKYYLKDE